MSTSDLELVDLTLLNRRMRRIIACIGLDKTLLLLDARGGTYLELPLGTRWRKHRVILAGLIGPDATDAFHREFAAEGRKMLLPKADKILVQARNRKICVEATDMSLREQALKYRMSVRAIQKIRAKGPAAVAAGSRNTDQYDLFVTENSANDSGPESSRAAGTRLKAV